MVICIMLDLNNSIYFQLLNYVGFDICGPMICRMQRRKEQTPQSRPVKRYIPRIYFFMDPFGVCICTSPHRPTKAVLHELHTRFAGSARVVLIASVPHGQERFEKPLVPS